MDDEKYQIFLEIYNLIKDDEISVSIFKELSINNEYSGYDFLKDYEIKNKE